jgi:DNA-binding transcriptional MerR regulator
VDDGKEPGALRTIGEVATALGVRQHVLRYWEQQFPMLRPLKRSGGRRYYRRDDVELLTRIDRLINGEGYTLKGARQAIEKGYAAPPTSELAPAEPSAPEAAAAPEPGLKPQDNDSEALLANLKRIRARLAEALDAAL